MEIEDQSLAVCYEARQTDHTGFSGRGSSADPYRMGCPEKRLVCRHVELRGVAEETPTRAWPHLMQSSPMLQSLTPEITLRTYIHVRN